MTSFKMSVKSLQDIQSHVRDLKLSLTRRRTVQEETIFAVAINVLQQFNDILDVHNELSGFTEDPITVIIDIQLAKQISMLSGWL